MSKPKSNLAHTNLPLSGWLKSTRLAEYFGVADNTIWIWAGKEDHPFPKPVKISENCTRWRAEDIHAFEASLEATD